MKKTHTTLAALLLAAGFASAASISVNFTESTGHANQQIASTTAAGHNGALNWNNLHGANSAGAVALAADSGPGASVTWSSGGVWGDGTANTDANAGVGNAQLTRGYLDDHSGGTPQSATIQVTSVPYALYDVVLYFSTDTGGDQYGASTVTGSSSGAQVIQPIPTKQQWGTNPTLDATNSVTAANVSGATLDIVVDPRAGDIRGSISGFQIIEVPEPATALFGGLAGLALLLRRRR